MRLLDVDLLVVPFGHRCSLQVDDRLVGLDIWSEPHAGWHAFDMASHEPVDLTPSQEAEALALVDGFSRSFAWARWHRLTQVLVESTVRRLDSRGQTAR